MGAACNQITWEPAMNMGILGSAHRRCSTVLFAAMITGAAGLVATSASADLGCAYECCSRNMSCTNEFSNCPGQDENGCRGGGVSYSRGTNPDQSTDIPWKNGSKFKKTNPAGPTCGPAQVYPPPCEWDAAAGVCRPPAGPTNPALWINAVPAFQQLRIVCENCAGPA